MKNVSLPICIVLAHVSSFMPKSSMETQMKSANIDIAPFVQLKQMEMKEEAYFKMNIYCIVHFLFSVRSVVNEK